MCAFCDGAGHTATQCPRTKPFDPRSEPEAPPRNRRIANIQGSSYDAPSEAPSWRKEAERFIGKQDRCMALGCDGAAEEGAHVWLQGERRFHYIAMLCKRCNHRHGHEEICYCRYIGRDEEPGAWIPIRDAFLYKMGTVPGAPAKDHAMRPFAEWCRVNSPPAHAFRVKCCHWCPGRAAGAAASGVAVAAGRG